MSGQAFQVFSLGKGRSLTEGGLSFPTFFFLEAFFNLFLLFLID